MALAQVKGSRSKLDAEDTILRRVLQVSLDPGDSTPPCMLLEELAAELLSQNHPLLLRGDLLERVVMEKLSALDQDSEQPFFYLVGCYSRAIEEGRKVQTMKDKVVLAKIQDALHQTKELAVSYAGLLLLHPEMVSQSAKLAQPTVSPLLTSIMSDVTSVCGGFEESSSGSGSVGSQRLPPGFLDHFVRRFADDGLDKILNQVFHDLHQSVLKVSPLGPFQAPLRALVLLVSNQAAATAFVNHPMWHPKGDHVNGRVLELGSLLGPFFKISVIPDHPAFGNGEPNVGYPPQHTLVIRVFAACRQKTASNRVCRLSEFCAVTCTIARPRS